MTQLRDTILRKELNAKDYDHREVYEFFTLPARSDENEGVLNREEITHQE